MSIAPQAAGFIITGENIIWGIGASESAAWDDLRANHRRARILHESEVDTDDTYCPRYWSEDQFHVVPATAALLAEVEARGGVIDWDSIAGLACTVAEADEANA